MRPLDADPVHAARRELVRLAGREDAALFRAALDWAHALTPPTLHVDPRIPVLIGLLERAAVQLMTDCMHLPEPWRASRRDLAIEIRRECER